jgi:hypothetical protein
VFIYFLFQVIKMFIIRLRLLIYSQNRLDIYFFLVCLTNLNLKGTVFWGITLYNLLKEEQLATYLHTGILFGLFDHEDGGDVFSKTSFDFKWATWHYIPEDRILHNHRCENLKILLT